MSLAKAIRLFGSIATIAVTPFRKAFAVRQMRPYRKLHLGCGARHLVGWANLDISSLGQIMWDLRRPLPVNDVEFVYAEHFIEHIPREDAVKLLLNLKHSLAPDGVIRISTPDLAKLIDDYRTGHLVQMDHGGWHPQTLCQMMNEGMREWGHEFVYDEAELFLLLRECGFERIERVAHGESQRPELRGLESRPDFADLIVECS